MLTCLPTSTIFRVVARVYSSVQRMRLFSCGRSLAWSRTGTVKNIHRRKPATLLIASRKGEKTPGFKSRRPHQPSHPPRKRPVVLLLYLPVVIPRN